jgi:hypothetical protein
VENVWRNSKKVNRMKVQTGIRWYFDATVEIYRLLPTGTIGDLKASQLPLSTKDSCAQDFDY